VVDGAVACSAAAWADLARAEIAQAHAAGKLPILVGGTGLYLRTLLDGIAPVPEIDEGVRAEVRALDPSAAHAALARLDPPMAARLNRVDRQRVMRALEVVRSTGRSLAAWQQQLAGGIAAQVDLRACVVDLDRDTLYARCDARFDAMLAGGALDEVSALLARDLAPDVPVMKALGVPALASHLRGDITLLEAADATKRDTRRYAKRQQTWFRHQASKWRRVTPDASLDIFKP
jgi:tRNA dimethylallyltransferase